jgi:hypothetical protein
MISIMGRAVGMDQSCSRLERRKVFKTGARIGIQDRQTVYHHTITADDDCSGNSRMKPDFHKWSSENTQDRGIGQL